MAKIKWEQVVRDTADSLKTILNIDGIQVQDIPTTISDLGNITEYINEQDVLVLNEAKNYTDAEILEWIGDTDVATQINTAVSGKADKTYVDSQDTATLTSAKSYTDTKIANLLDNDTAAVDSIMELAEAMKDNSDAIEALTTIAGNKVDKVDGKGLSTNDYTTAEKNKLAGIAAGAEVNVQSDWNATSGDAMILNKPTIPSKTSQLTNDSGYLTSHQDISGKADKTYVDTQISNLVGDTDVATQINDAMATIPQSDWNQNDETAADYIKNRPFYVKGLITTTLIDNAEGEITNRRAAFSNLYSLELIEGKDYIVTWNGVDYNTTCTLLNGALAIGNASIVNLGENTEEPFIFAVVDGLLIYTNDDDGPITISIKYNEVDIQKLDYKYINLPEGAYVGENGTGINAEIFNDYSSNIASGEFSHAEGRGTTASDYYSHAEGYKTTASGQGAHAEGWETVASGQNSHAEGRNATASNWYSHAEGLYTTASGHYSHAEGGHTTASEYGSHAEGYYIVASGLYQHAQGKYNVEDTTNTYAHIVGNGSSDSRSNAHTLDWSGNAWFQGDVYVGSTSGTNKDEGSKKLATESYVSETITYVVGDTDVPTQINTAIAAIPTPTFSVTDDGNGNVTIMLG